MTREEIEAIIRRCIRTNGRGEITAKVMAAVLEAFVTYTDSTEDKFIELVQALADAFSALVEEMEGKFENKADALEAALEQFCSNLLTNNFEPWAEALATALGNKMDLTKDAADDAKTAAISAKDSAQTASGKADDAKTAAVDAKAAAQTASQKADDAKTAAGQAKTAAETASGKADDAKTAAGDAKTAAQTAAQKSDDAKTAAQTASGKADDAKTAAIAAKDAIDVESDGIAEALAIIREGNHAPAEEMATDPHNCRVVFIDYDGTILKDVYVRPGSAVEAPDTSELPAHPHLTFNRWNYSAADLADVQHDMCVGALYRVEDGATWLKVNVPAGTAVVLTTNSAPSAVDWGDGTVDANTSHTYAADYSGWVKVTDGGHIIGWTWNGYNNQGTAPDANNIMYYAEEALVTPNASGIMLFSYPSYRMTMDAFPVSAVAIDDAQNNNKSLQFSPSFSMRGFVWSEQNSPCNAAYNNRCGEFYDSWAKTGTGSNNYSVKYSNENYSIIPVLFCRSSNYCGIPLNAESVVVPAGLTYIDFYNTSGAIGVVKARFLGSVIPGCTPGNYVDAKYVIIEEGATCGSEYPLRISARCANLEDVAQRMGSVQSGAVEICRTSSADKLIQQIAATLTAKGYTVTIS